MRNGKKVHLDARVKWDETAVKLDDAALDKRAVIIGDADRGMRKALVNGERFFQLLINGLSRVRLNLRWLEVNFNRR